MKRHAASLVVVLLALAGCGGWEGGQTPGTQTVLQIKAWPNGRGRDADPREWRLHCERSGGTLPAPEKACEQLFALDEPFAPTPGGQVCTEIYGGPAVAEIEGLFRGETVNATFSRSDGCEIARWDRHSFLFPVDQPASDNPSSTASSLLSISVWPRGKNRIPNSVTIDLLRCDRPADDPACERLAGMSDPFAATPPAAICTGIYGGPAVAEVEGTHEGKRVSAQFNRTDGCEIARWDRHAFLFPVKPGRP